MKISGNTVLITGGTSGIGFAIAEFFLRNDNEVIITGRRKDKLEEAGRKHSRLKMMVSDASDEIQRKELYDWISSGFNKLNILVNNAGIQQDIDFRDGLTNPLQVKSEIEINLTAPILLSGMFVPLLSVNRDSAIINITSGLAFIPAAKTPVYSATKAALHAFTMALRFQLRNSGIKVFEIIPPAVDTELNPEGRASRGNYKPELKPDEFVEGVMKSFENDIPEIGYGMTEDLKNASRQELDQRFERMNSQW